MIVRRLVATTLLIAACSRTPAPSDNEGWQAFSLGVMPLQYASGNELRYIVSIPRRYINPTFLPKPSLVDRAGRVVANNVAIAVSYPSLQPTKATWAKGAVRATVGNLVENGISSTVDGSWLNYYSGYSVDLSDQYELHQRRRSDFDPLDGRLFFRISAGLHVRIECKKNINDAEKWCVMAARHPGEPLLETGFSFVELPDWRERLTRLQSLYRMGGREPLGPVHKQS